MACSSPTLDISESSPKRVKLSRINTLEQMEAMKEEIKRKIDLLRDQLNTKECELLEEVDRLGTLQLSQNKVLEEELKELKELKISLSSSKLNKMKDAVELAITGFEKKIYEISQKLDQYEEINYSWETDPIQSGIEHLCSLSNVTNIESVYQSKSVPKWSILIGDKPSQLSSPTSLAIQQDTDNVFVSDKKGGRIQVYSSLGEHIRLIEKFNCPLNVFHVDRAFIVGMTPQKCQFMELNLESLVSRALKNQGCYVHTFVASYMDSNS